MANQQIVGVIDKVQVSFRGIKIVDADGNVRMASFGENIYEGEKIFSDDETAIIEIKYEGLKENVTYEGVFDILAQASVIQEVDEKDNLIETDINFDDIETAAGEDGLNSTTNFVTFDTSNETLSIRDVEIKDEIFFNEFNSFTQDNSSINLNFDENISSRNLLIDEVSKVDSIYESNLLNLGAGEQTTYIGEKIVTNFQDIKNVEFSDVSLIMTTNNQYLISIAENLKEIENEDTSVIVNLIKDMTSDFLHDNLESPVREMVTVEIPSRGVALLENDNFINIGMLPSGEYQITSPLFNAMGNGDSIEVLMNYSVNGKATQSIGVKIFGENDTPVALDAKQDVTLNDDGGYTGLLPGTGGYSVSLLKSIKV